MSFSCSQCSFKAQFESALTMHHQLYHEKSVTNENKVHDNPSDIKVHNSKVLSVSECVPSSCGALAPSRTSSNTKLFFNKLYSKISKSKNLHLDTDSINKNHMTLMTSKQIPEKILQKNINSTSIAELNNGQTFGCHLCSFVADRITVLDRHLLKDHDIGLDNLLKLVMAKTKEALVNEDIIPNFTIPYYKPPNEIYHEGDVIIENVTPKIRILKNVAVNTDLKLTDIPDLNVDCRIIKSQLENIIEKSDTTEGELLSKMKVLNDYMCKFIDSSNTLKRVLNKEYSKSRQSLREKGLDESKCDFSVGDYPQRKPLCKCRRPKSCETKGYDDDKDEYYY